MNDAANYKVEFGKTARTLLYEDTLGTILFVFDVSVGKDESTGKSRFYLDNRPMIDRKAFEPKTEAERHRVAVALERTKQYATSCGYLVEVSEY
jgi:hypothetical protein